ncbi:MAG: Stk1 family Ser/Thr kinase [Pseudomonadota bacterium]
MKQGVLTSEEPYGDVPPHSGEPCPGEELLAAFAAGVLQGDDLQGTEAHVSLCDDCLLVVAAALQSSRDALCVVHVEEQSLHHAQLRERFELGELIAEGGMGDVYAGLDLQTGERVAIKCVRSDHASDYPDSQERFVREGEILGKLEHPNIVRRIAVVEMGQRWHIVMEYVPGGSLREALRVSPRLPLQQVLRIGLEVADALARAHHLGIVHRDLKPENVLLAADGTPRLSDFGLARGLEPSITRSGVLLGTLAYVSPEALSELQVDARADLWSLGVILFEMLSGERPFRGHNMSAVLSAILHQPAPHLAELRPEAPPALGELLQRLLQKDPAKRVPSARQLGAELEAIARELQTSSWCPAQPPAPLPLEQALRSASGVRRVAGRC